MKRRREQRGHVYAEHGKYFVRYRDYHVIGGELKRARLRKELGPVDGMTKGQARERAKEILATVNKPRLSPETAVRLAEFVQTVYFPRLQQRTRPSTVSGYRVLWRQLQPFCDRLWIRDVRTKHVQDILDGLVKTHRLNVNSLRHIKSFLSGVFKLALQQGYYEGPNPVRETTISGVRPPKETHAYTLEEIEAMLKALPEPASTVIMTAALTGTRRGELRGMFWENYRDREMLIVRWPRHRQSRTVLESRLFAKSWKRQAASDKKPRCTRGAYSSSTRSPGLPVTRWLNCANHNESPTDQPSELFSG